MSQRLAILSNSLDDAGAIVDALRAKGHTDDDIYVVTKHDIILEDLPEADPRQYSDLLPTLKQGAGVGGALGLFGGLLMVTLPPAGIAIGGGAIAAFAAGGAALGAWTSSLIGIRMPNSKLEDFQAAIENGKTLVLVDVEDEASEPLIDELRALRQVEISKIAFVEAA